MQGILDSRNLPWPVDWSALYGDTRPLIVEIGFGRGAYLRHLSQSFPDAGIIGLEIANQCLETAERMIVREGLYNVRVIHSPAETALYHLFEPGSIAQIHINFPDPWFKKSHHHRRLIRQETMDLLISRLAPGGELYIATDILEYAQITRDLLESVDGIRSLLTTGWTHAMPGRIITKYEATARREGRMCYYFAYRRTEAPVPVIPVLKELEMPHAVVHVPLSLAEIAERFEPIRYSQDNGEYHVHISEAFLGRNGILFETYIGEPTIRQHAALGVYNYGQGEKPNTYTVQLMTIGQPRATQGAHLAVRLLRDWLLALHSEAKLLHQKVAE